MCPGSTSVLDHLDKQSTQFLCLKAFLSFLKYLEPKEACLSQLRLKGWKQQNGIADLLFFKAGKTLLMEFTSLTLNRQLYKSPVAQKIVF